MGRSAGSAHHGGGYSGGYPGSGPLASVREEGGRGSNRPRLFSYKLRVHPEHGAGIDLQPESRGMRVENIYDIPGQPGLLRMDLITKIQEVSLRGNAEAVEKIFGTHFC